MGKGYDLMMFCIIITTLLSFDVITVSGQTDFTFAQMATGPGSVCKGGNATFSCEIVNAGGVIQPNQWRFPNDIVINFNTPHHTLVLDTATSLVSDLIVTDINERAVYVCSLAAKPELVSRVYINAEGTPPSPVGEITVIKGSLNFTASWDPVTNDLVCGGPLSYDVRISPSSGVMMMRITDTSYNFTGLTSDSIYTVTVAGRNNIGVGESASVMVSFAEFIFRQTATGPGKVCSGGTATFSCEIIDEMISVLSNEWRYANNIPIPAGTPHHTLVQNNATSLITDLIVTNIHTSTSYICGPQATPKVMSEVSIDVKGPPSSVSDFYARRDCSYFFVSFSPATGDPVCGPVSHSFRVIPSDFEEFDIPRYELDRLSDTDYEISDVEPNNYTFSVIGLNNAGFGPIFNSMMFTVGGPPSPGNFILADTDICTNDFVIAWDPFTSDELCGSLYYRVIISPSDGVMMKRITGKSYHFTGLTSGSSYMVTVTGENDDGFGEPTSVAVNTPTMEEALPAGVLNMRNAFVDCSLLVEWDPSNSSYCGGPLYQVVISSDGDVVHNITTTRTTVTFSDVMSDTAYNVTVIAVNRLGVGATEMTNVFTGGSNDDDDNDNDNDDDDGLSTGAAVGITAVVTLIIALVIAVPVTTIVAIMCYKHYSEKRNNDSTQENSQFVLMDRDVKMDTNPSDTVAK